MKSLFHNIQNRSKKRFKPRTPGLQARTPGMATLALFGVLAVLMALA